MIRAEWRFLRKHPLLLGVLCAIALIPMIYTTIFLSSMWDPYGRMDHLKVAVVNHDQPTTYQGQKLKVGKDLTKQLAKSDQMGFTVVDSEQKAKAGLHSGKYYMIITIPKNFSKNAATVLNQHPQKMKLHYETSYGHSFIGGKMAETGAKSLTKLVSRQVSYAYSQLMVKLIKKSGQGISTAASGSAKLADGTTQLQSGNQQITNGLQTLADSTVTFSDGTQTLANGLSQYVNGVAQAQSGSQQLTSGLNQLNDKVPALTSGVSQLNNGAASLANGLGQLNAKTGSLASGTAALSSGASSLDSGLGTLKTGSQQVTDGLNQLSAAVNGKSADIQKLQAGIQSLQTQLNSLNTASADTSGVQTALQTLASDVQTVAAQQSKLRADIQSTASAQNLTSDQTAALLAVVDNNTTATTQKLSNDVTELSNQFKSLSTSSAGKANLTSAQALLQQTSTALGYFSTIGTNTQRLAAGSQQVTTGLQSAQSGASQLSAGTAQLNSQVPVLTNAVSQLSSGAGQLAAGTSQLNNSTGTLASGVAQLTSGSQQLTSGLGQLTANNNTLLSGTSQLGNGALQLSAGAQKLLSGSQQMDAGLVQVHDGNQTLANKLEAAAKKISKLHLTKRNAKQLADPVAGKHTDHTSVANNGTGMAPYMLGISMYVGVMALNLMYDVFTPRRYPKNGRSWWAAKISVVGGFAIVQALIAYIDLIWFLGLKPVHPFATTGILVIGSLTFAAIVTFLNVAFGKVGMFLTMVLLVLQLSGSNGTYPLPLTNSFFIHLNPWLPMSYVVHGLRETLMIGSSVWPDIAVLMIFMIIFGGATMIVYRLKLSKLPEAEFEKMVPDYEK